jgi:hypothetical protein
LAAIIFFSLYANFFTQGVSSEGLLHAFWENGLLFLAAMGFYGIFAKLDERWLEANHGDKPFDRYYDLLDKRQLIVLYVTLVISMLFLCGFLVFCSGHFRQPQ